MRNQEQSIPSLAAIAEMLRTHGIEVAGVTESDDPSVEDDEVRVNGEVHVQVGDTYLIANRWDEKDGTMFHGVSRSRSKEGVAALVGDLQAHLSTAAGKSLDSRSSS